ncbi:MAG: VWA domain-containing protein [Acidobacteria bacterium]|nr:VWA domain-containing protein [Acidobacteriota bacterium]
MKKFVLLSLLCLWSSSQAVGAAVRDCAGSKGVNILLVDNSRSVPHMDPTKDRVQVLREILEHLRGYENRIILFGGTREILVDHPEAFRNDALHTDFYGALEEAVRIRQEYPQECVARFILITDGILDPGKEDYPGQRFTHPDQVKSFSRSQTLDLLEKAGIPVYFILLGSNADMELIRDMSIHANGYLRASPLMENASAFLGNNGSLFKRFIFVHQPADGIKGVNRILDTVVSENRPYIETFLYCFPFALLLALIILAIRIFPAPGDTEEILLSEGTQVFIGADTDDPSVIANPAHLNRKRGLVCVSKTASAHASIVLQRRHFNFTSRGLVGLDKLDPISRRLLDEDITKLGERLKQMEASGRDDEVIVATDLRYYCSNLELDNIRAILQARESDRMDIDCKEFLLAKVYISLAPDLLEEFTEYKVFLTIPAKNIIRSQVKPGQKYPVGPYVMRVVSVAIDSRFDARVKLAYHRAPSAFGLKRLIPVPVQKVLRLRRSRKNVFNPS